ncbi:MAG: 50S ribosomal protein L25/general stress protein Ctc [Proteobacteria bacterium]|nr:50S ribosomal protein L25/general stress protein Ctc [Pseudomonadota bacterium]MBU4258687.1 50S ribosomal protein L25/general stress protein Ctc [Pseudomonadota bacterium]MBU4287706.1 50S ribosomal protein L25/general stress protein Ctc [Pseudomonadota bacterium]MCG2757468.1 50S ribosomal protein L25/general stress protein Ctc [Desulfobacteraceae bacterium]
MELIELKANIRNSVGKGQARVLRRAKKIPAVLYGPGAEPVLLSVAISDLEKALKKTTASQALLNLTIHNGENTSRTAMIKELQTHPVSRNYIHVDFYEISMDRKILVKVPVTVKGKTRGVELGGILQIIRRELEILCLPTEIPETIEIDVTDLDIGDSIHVKEIPFQGDIEVPADVNFTVITMLAPKTEEEVSEEGEEEAEEAVAGEEPPEAESEE